MNAKIVFIINPIAGKGKGKMVAQEIISFFESKPFVIRLMLSEYEGHTQSLIQQAIDLKPQLIVACGGDGTIHEVAQALVHTSIQLGIIPIGSGNGLARNLNIPLKTKDALHVLIHPKNFKMDVGELNEHYFFSNCGIGIDAFVIQQYQKAKVRNFIGYFKSVYHSLFKYQPIPCKITIDGKKLEEKPYFFLLCANSNIAGYDISFTPEADLNDGKLDLLGVEPLNFLEFIAFSLCVWARNPTKMRKAKIYQFAEAKIVTPQESILAQLDGESLQIKGATVHLRLWPKALNVAVPNHS